ncbi:hypothetical protein BDK92_4419 [Micromonospora pisi]|uniref:ABC-2 type transport system permease protein n=1 Tax=Micromonospora pisi TaxID=589240 RepID=A0A495JMJ0_9ACTN|nr:hypothetical protein [Micromonospora pisi]RKR90051.1 hypothetical protein BDK92_4419 [Micromonospora pisi]
MIPLTLMRLTGFVRTGRALAPLIAGLVVLAVLYGGGQAQAGEAYGVSAVVIFPVLAWQTKLLLDVEPDVARRLALVTVGSRGREAVAGLVAAGLAGIGTVAVALVLPWLLGGVVGPKDTGDLPLAEGIALGVWAHLLVLPAAVALGALASRAASDSPRYGVLILVGGVVGAIVFGLRDSVVPWLAPPMMATARATTSGPTGVRVVELTVHALLWSAAALALYGWLRRRRA